MLFCITHSSLQGNRQYFFFLVLGPNNLQRTAPSWALIPFSFSCAVGDVNDPVTCIDQLDTKTVADSCELFAQVNVSLRKRPRATKPQQEPRIVFT